MLYLPSYKDRVYKVFGVIVLLDRETSTMKEEYEEGSEMNENFLKKIIKKEIQMNNFAKKYYDLTLNLPHTSSNKVCRIRELNVAKSEDEEGEGKIDT